MNIIKKSIEKYSLYLINLFLIIFLVSCYKNISVEWRIIGEPEDKLLEIMLLNSADIELCIGKSKNIKIPTDSIYIGQSHSGNFIVYYKPNINNLKNNEHIEIFVFPRYIEQENITDTKTKNILEEHPDVLAYFYKFHVEENVYIAILPKSQFYLDKEDFIIGIEPEFMDLNFFNNLNDIIIFYSLADTAFYNEYFFDYGGYIIQSNIDGTIIWLDPKM